MIDLNEDSVPKRKHSYNMRDIYGNFSHMKRELDAHYYLIPDEERPWWRKVRIRNREYQIYHYICQHTENGICSTVSYKVLSEFLGCPVISVRKSIGKLEDLGLIRKEFVGMQWKRSVYRVTPIDKGLLKVKGLCLIFGGKR